MVDSVFFPSTSFTDTDPSVDGNLNEYQYFLATDQSCGISTGQLQSDTLTSILLNSSTSNLNTIANLSWNNNHDPLLLTSDSVFDVYMKRDNISSQQIIDSTSTLSFSLMMLTLLFRTVIMILLFRFIWRIYLDVDQSLHLHQLI